MNESNNLRDRPINSTQLLRMTIFLSQNLSKYFNRLDWDKTMPIRASTKIPKFHRSQQGMLCRKLTNSTIEFKMFTIIMLHITRYTS